MHRLNRKGVKATTRPGGYKINSSWADIKTKGAIPPNYFQGELFESPPPDDVIVSGNNSANDTYTLRCKAEGVKIHPARFPRALPEFFINMLTEHDDIVLDPFSGSNTTGAVAESLNRRWIAFDNVEEYVRGSKFRFE
jgi:site-specific DNA-methyltransferase (cytosine-N4-specific)